MRAGKNNFAEVAVYAAILSALLGWRVRQYLKKRAAVSASGRVKATGASRT
jgi:sulfoxide reductase heme-binding subunit YedZ